MGDDGLDMALEGLMGGLAARSALTSLFSIDLMACREIVGHE